MQTLWQDIRFAIRMFAKQPGFTAVAVLTLMLGIGANTAIFSVVNSVLLRPLPYAQPERLMHAFRMQPPVSYSPVSRPAFLDFEAQQKVFDPFAAHYGQTFNLTGVDQAERLIGRRVTSSFFSLFGLSPVRGRFFQPSDDQPDSPRVAVISYGLWERRFGSDPEVVGKTIKLNGDAHTVIGIAPPQFQFPARVEIWTPALLAASQSGRGNNFLMMVGRLKDSVTTEQASAQMNQIAAALAQQYPGNHAKLSILVSPMLEEQVRNIRSVLWILLGAVSLVLLIACANVANLLLARATARRREFAIRVALGAGRWHIVRQLLTESVLLAALSGALGVLLAFGGIKLLVAFAPGNLPRVREVRIDMWVLGFTLLVSLFTGLIFGLAPMGQVSRAGVNETLKEGARGVMGGSSQAWLRRVLVMTEIALSLVLLIGAGLLITSARRLLAVNPGFDPHNLLTADISYPRKPASAYPQNDEGRRHSFQDRSNFLREVEQKVTALPGVRSVGVINDLPVTGQSSVNGSFIITGQTDLKWADAPVAEFRCITPNYFNAMGIPLLKGRAFSDRDTPQTPVNIIINEALQRRFFPNEDPLGKSLKVMDGNPHEIIGVAGNARQWGLNLPPSPEIYVSTTQLPNEETVSLVVRTQADPAGLAEAVRRAVRAVNPDAPVFRVRTMEDVISASTAAGRFNTILMTVFAVVALLMAAIGLYGVMSYSVTQRTHEIGVRMALGAQKRDVSRLVVGQGMILTLAGVVLGLGAAYALTRFMATLLFGISPTDPVTFAVIALLLTVIAFVACYLPARRATKVDPMIALRYE